MISASTPRAAEPERELVSRLIHHLEQIIRGKREALELVVCAVAAGGHVLLEDVPGTGKTTLAKALAAGIGGEFKRVQFTPDLLPTDIIGSSIFVPQESLFRFRPGPLFANVLIADEINRASPRTQSALLEALSEGQVTVDGQTHVLAPPFLCLATQNPVEFHGTYPLPEASLDRFAVQLSLGYLPEDEERTLLMTRSGPAPLDGLRPVCSLQEVARLQARVQEVRLEESVADYLLRLVQATRGHPSLKLGVSTRGALLYGRLARARALMQGRDYVLPEDLKALAVPVLAHRLVLDTRARYAGSDKRVLMQELTASVPVPR